MKFTTMFIRMLTMVPVVLSVFWTVLSQTGLLVAVLASWSAIVVAEASIWERLRTRILGVGSVILWCLLYGVQHAVLDWSLIASVVGPVQTLWLDTILWAGVGLGSLVLLLRVLAKRSSFWFFVEMSLIALGTAVIFFPHQYKIIMRPLWLSDLAWSIGLEPSMALGLIGAALATCLSVLTVFEQSNRRHVSVVIFPLLALLTLIFVDPLEMDTPPPPEQLQDILNGGQSDATGDEGDSRGSGEGDENEQTVNSGQQEKQSGSGGQPPPVAVVLLGDDYSPINEVFYFRQEIQSLYNGLRLVAPTDRSIPYNAPRGFPDTESQFLVPPSHDVYRKTVLADVALLTEHTSPFILETGTSYTPTINPRPGRFNRTYRTTSSSLNIGYEGFLEFHIGNPEWDASYWSHLTDRPRDSRYAELAEDIVASLPLEYHDNLIAQAFAVKLYLDEQTQYTMSERHENAEDPTGEFLFGSHAQFTGYCVHTSHAAVFLWRALGIPARVGVGYATPMEQQKGSAVLVLANDAHSWPELYIEELGWVILDVAPQTVLDEMGEGPDLEILDALEELARAEPDSQFRRAINWKALWAEYRGYILNGISFVVVTFFVGLWIRKGRRRLMYRSNPSTYWVYVSALDALSEQGVIRCKGESPEQFAGRINIDYPSFTPIVWAHIGMIFGDKAGDANVLTVHRKTLSTEIVVNTSGWRWLGWFNPFSPWSSR
jgi:transglutaminase-like putative cysteine protease